MKVKHAKRRGDWAELYFMARAAEHGLCISKPWGETAHYDFVVETGGKLLRVQVKSTFSNRKGNTAAGCTPAGARMRRMRLIAVYLAPEKLWYVIPAGRSKGEKRS